MQSDSLLIDIGSGVADLWLVWADGYDQNEPEFFAAYDNSRGKESAEMLAELLRRAARGREIKVSKVKLWPLLHKVAA